MFSFSRLFVPSRRVSRLEERLQEITLDDAARVYETAPDPNIRVPGAISMTVLCVAHRFIEGLLKMEGDLGKRLKTPSHQSSYDAGVFEVAAYAHFWLMKDYLQAEVNRMDDYAEDDEACDEDDSEEPRYAALRTSTLISDSFIKRYTEFDLPDRLFSYRAMSYCRSTDTQIDISALIGRFEHQLFCSILAGRPVQQERRELGHLALDITVKAEILMFHSTLLAALPEMIDILFTDSEKGTAILPH